MKVRCPRCSDCELLVTVQGPRPENILFLVHEVFEGLISESFQGVTYDYMLPCPDCQKFVSNTHSRCNPHTTWHLISAVKQCVLIQKDLPFQYTNVPTIMFFVRPTMVSDEKINSFYLNFIDVQSTKWWMVWLASLCVEKRTHKHARTHERTHAHTHTHTRTHTLAHYQPFLSFYNKRNES